MIREHRRAAGWALAAGGTGFVIAEAGVAGRAVSREWFVLAYALAAATLTIFFVERDGFHVAREIRRHPLRTALATTIATALALASVMAQPGGGRAHGTRLLFEIVWSGIVYGAADGALLTVVPMAAFGEMRASRWTSNVLALVASVAVFTLYHLGFPEFRNATLLGPIASSVIFGVAYLACRNPIAPVLAHVAMHVAAVLHGPAGTLQLPPHY